MPSATWLQVPHLSALPPLPMADFAFRILASALMGSIIGWEREGTQKSAGLRTHMLVCVGSTLFTIASMIDWTPLVLMSHASQAASMYDANTHITINRDPTRIAAQIVTGIGFIGGGALIKDGVTIRGVTTAASLWSMAAIGIIVGIGYWQLALFSTMLCFIILYTMGRLEGHLFQKHLRDHAGIRLEIRCRQSESQGIAHQLDTLLIGNIISVEQHPAPSRDGEAPVLQLLYEVSLEGKQLNWNKLHHQLGKLEGVLASKMSFIPRDELR